MGNRQGRKKQQKGGGGAPAAAGATPPPPPGGTAGGGAGAPGGRVHIHRRYSHVAHNGGEREIGLNSFEIMKVLGKGSFGKVMLVRKKDTHKIYAMKTLRKAQLLKRNQIAHTATERNILQNLNHPFLCELQFAFQSKDKLYMVLEFMPGGELFFWLKQQRRFSANRCKLYAAEILLGLGFLHAHDIIYRDLKPENILMDGDGHLRITDFGLSKDGVKGEGAKNGTTTFCGTPEYLAPELLENKGHGKAVDWWSLGTLLFEMMTGLPPFYDQNMQRMYDKILHSPLRVPEYVGPDAKSILTGLLQRKVSERLGSNGDQEQIKAHAYWRKLGTRTLDWGAVERKEYSPEFKPPNRSGSLDVANFDREFTSQKAADSYVPSNLSATQVAQTNFQGFTYQGPSNLNPHDSDEEDAGGLGTVGEDNEDED